MARLSLEAGAVDPALATEFPGLALWSACTPGGARRSPRDVRDRLRGLSDRMRGAQAVELRREPVPLAHRVFFRHIGLEPDEQRVPAEEAAMRRLLDGGHRSHGLPQDALTIAVVETGVGLWALDEAAVEGPLGLRLPDGGALVVADARGTVARVFEPVAPERAVTRRTRTTRLFAIQVPGVPAMAVGEAFALALDALGDGR